jgi:hypothetical protein
MALKKTELTETSSGWQSRQFYCLTRATFKRRTPSPSPRLCMPRRPVSLCYTSVLGCGLRRATSLTLELIKYHSISEDVGSYHKPDDEDRISLWSVCRLKKIEVAWDYVCWNTSNVKSWKITRMQVKSSYISVLIGMRLLFLFVLLMNLLHSVRALSGE